MPGLQRASIGILGFSPAEQTMLELFFGTSQNRHFELASAEQAQSLLINLSDASTAEGVQQWLKAQSGRVRLPGIAVVSAAEAAGDWIPLLRPLSMPALVTALETLFQRLNQIEEADSDASATGADNPAFVAWQRKKAEGQQALQDWRSWKGKEEGEASGRFKLSRSEMQAVVAKAQKVVAHKQAQQQAAPAEADKPKAPKINPAYHVLTQEMVFDCVGHQPDQDLSASAGLRKVRYNADVTLLPWVVKAVRLGRESKRAQQVQGVPGLLIYLPERDVFYTDLDSDLLLHMGRARFGMEELSLAELDVSSAIQDETVRHVPADQLLWRLALFTSRGRVAESLPLDKPLQLIRKPDFSVFDPTPHANEIADFWYSKRASAVDLVRQLALPQRYVFSFMVAADAVGLFNP